MNTSCELASSAKSQRLATSGFNPVEVVNPLECNGWDQRLQGHEQATLFHSAAWARVLHQTYGFRPFYLVQSHGGRFAGLLPLMEVRSPWGGRRAVSLPFTDACPLLTPAGEPAPDLSTLRDPVTQPGESVGNQILRRAGSLAGERKWTRLELRPGKPDAQMGIASVRFFNHTVRLKETDAEQMAACEATVRRCLRQAQAGNLRVSIGADPEMLRTYFGLHCLTRKRQGAPAQPMRFFANIQRELLTQGRGFIVLASQGLQAVAGAVFFHAGQRVDYKFGASDLAFQHLRPNHRVMWTGLRHGAQLGCTTLDLGRTSLGNEGLCRFKRGWGAAESIQAYHCLDTRAGRWLPVPDLSSGWQSRLLRRLPVWVGRTIGELTYRFAA